jgi:hypothetical protein
VLPEGEVNVPVILVEYADVKFTFTKELFQQMLNEEGYDAPTYYSNVRMIGSARDYFRDQSHGKFIPNFVVSDVVTASQNMEYYGGNDASGNDLRVTYLVKEACLAMDEKWDFSIFDNNKDGEVEFTLGFDSISEEIVQTKVRFESEFVTITAILSCDDSLLGSVPCGGIRGRANANYPYSVNVNKDAIIQTINRLTLFNSGKSAFSKPYGKFVFGKDSVTIYDYNMENSEVVNYSSGEVANEYTAMLNLNDLKTTLETCVESHLCISFGDSSAVVISRGNIKNVIPEVKLV